LRKFGRKQGRLTTVEPSSNNHQYDDLEPFFARYRALLDRVEKAAVPMAADSRPAHSCGGTGPLYLELIEALYLHTRANIALHAEERRDLINTAARNGEAVDGVLAPCPLERESGCLLPQFRPLRCRIDQAAVDSGLVDEWQKELAILSRDVFFTVFGFNIDEPPCVHVADVVSGRFVQSYFHYIADLSAGKNR